jgi:hypothetical protein
VDKLDSLFCTTMVVHTDEMLDQHGYLPIEQGASEYEFPLGGSTKPLPGDDRTQLLQANENNGDDGAKVTNIWVPGSGWTRQPVAKGKQPKQVIHSLSI